MSLELNGKTYEYQAFTKFIIQVSTTFKKTLGYQNKYTLVADPQVALRIYHSLKIGKYEKKRIVMSHYEDFKGQQEVLLCSSKDG